jgi:hypothetical protein
MMLLAGLALADDSARAWETLYDARLVEATDGTPEVARLYYEELTGDLEPTDPLFGTTWYWLGRTRFVLGDTSAAVTALRTALRDPGSQAQASALLARIELRNRAITALPIEMDFSRGPSAFVRAWEEADKGQLTTKNVGGHAVLSWGTTVRASEPDRIAAALETKQGLQSVAFSVQSGEFPAELRVTLSDGAGGRYSAPVFQVPAGKWLQVSLPIASFRATDAPRGGATAIRPGEPVRLLEIEDLTGLLTPERGENILYLDHVEIH